VASAQDVPRTFDANRDAQRKLYRYVIHDGRTPNLFLRKYCFHTRRRLDAAAMSRASCPLRGRHDFHSFETDWPNRMSSVRTITHLAVNRFGDWIWLDVEADGFLYNMVRSIAGTLIEVGRGYWPESAVADILLAEDRKRAGPTAPAQGLFLMRVTYDHPSA
jgi:tRNA pseudouridine38-40 synthase